MGIEDNNFIVIGSATGSNFAGFFTRAKKNEPPPLPFGGIVYGADAGLSGVAGSEGPAQQNSYSRVAGVMGSSSDATGVAGASLRRVGVYGQLEDENNDMPDPPLVPTGLLAGVFGTATAEPGVIGFSRQGDGMQGASFAGIGLRALSFFGPGLHSISGDLSGVTGISGTPGPPVANPNVPNAAGVFGSSASRPGVIGTSNTQVGVVGFSNAVGVFGQAGSVAGLAGLFQGNVLVNGTLGATVKNALVPFPDGTQRVLHCVESPDHWFEDFGTAKLKNGRATVRLDPDFAKVVQTSDYHVFIMPGADCRGLYVGRKTTEGFEVREIQNGTSSVAFSYNIVARRKDIKQHRRFARIDAGLPVPPPPTPRKPGPRALRAFVATLEREARKRRPKGAKKTRSSRALPNRV
ncbi:MAG TPA: hypothetical protein VH249_13015 [Xanthobacteraceae bacterium]|jgi:hypothetical protein|nr:hypothetical protein [Xanthobacteraceae bacterium]